MTYKSLHTTIVDMRRRNLVESDYRDVAKDLKEMAKKEKPNNAKDLLKLSKAVATGNPETVTEVLKEMDSYTVDLVIEMLDSDDPGFAKKVKKQMAEELEEITTSTIIKLNKVKNDQEIYDRIKKLKDAGIYAASGSGNNKTDIIVDKKDVEKAKKILGENVIVNAETGEILKLAESIDEQFDWFFEEVISEQNTAKRHFDKLSGKKILVNIGREGQASFNLRKQSEKFDDHVDPWKAFDVKPVKFGVKVWSAINKGRGDLDQIVKNLDAISKEKITLADSDGFVKESLDLGDELIDEKAVSSKKGEDYDARDAEETDPHGENANTAHHSKSVSSINTKGNNTSISESSMTQLTRLFGGRVITENKSNSATHKVVDRVDPDHADKVIKALVKNGFSARSSQQKRSGGSPNDSEIIIGVDDNLNKAKKIIKKTVKDLTEAKDDDDDKNKDKDRKKPEKVKDKIDVNPEGPDEIGVNEDENKVTPERLKNAKKFVKQSNLSKKLKVDDKGISGDDVNIKWDNIPRPIPKHLKKHILTGTNMYIAKYGKMPPGTRLLRRQGLRSATGLDEYTSINEEVDMNEEDELFRVVYIDSDGKTVSDKVKAKNKDKAIAAVTSQDSKRKIRKVMKFKEEVDMNELTDAQEKKKEEIVKKLKKKTDDFKEKYGDKWESVMYATATKMAKKAVNEAINPDKEDVADVIDGASKSEAASASRALTKAGIENIVGKSSVSGYGVTVRHNDAKKADAVLKKVGIKESVNEAKARPTDYVLVDGNEIKDGPSKNRKDLDSNSGKVYQLQDLPDKVLKKHGIEMKEESVNEGYRVVVDTKNTPNVSMLVDKFHKYGHSPRRLKSGKIELDVDGTSKSDSERRVFRIMQDHRKQYNESVNEAVKIDKSRYVRSHGKNPGSAKAAWMFTTQKMGEPSKDDVFMAKGPQKFSDAAYQAKKWAKEKGADIVYVMEDTDNESVDEGNEADLSKIRDKELIKLHRLKMNSYEKEKDKDQKKREAKSLNRVAKELQSRGHKNVETVNEDTVKSKKKPEKKYPRGSALSKKKSSSKKEVNEEDKERYNKVFRAVAKHLDLDPEKIDQQDKETKKKFFNMLDRCWDTKSDTVPDSCPIDIDIKEDALEKRAQSARKANAKSQFSAIDKIRKRRKAAQKKNSAAGKRARRGPMGGYD